MRKNFIIISLLFLSTMAIGQNTESTYIVIKGDLSVHGKEIDSIDINSYIIDSSNALISYFKVLGFLSCEIYHEFELTSDIHTYRLLITDNEKNKGNIEFYIPLSLETQTIEIIPGIELNIKSIKTFDQKEFHKHMKQEPRLRSTFDPERHRIEIKN